VTLDELKKKLVEMEPGKYAAIHYDLFAELFPPGEPDDKARAACGKFAFEAGCRVENKIQEQNIWFVKDAPRS
jgi:hypothetical protein